MKRLGCLLLLLATLVVPAYAHVGNKDVFEQVTAGPYKLFVTIRTPTVIPGVATIEVRSNGSAVNSLSITPLMLTGEASKHPPTPDPLKRSADDPAFFTGSLWIMASGSWQVRLGIDGASGPATTSIPVAAAPTVILHMQRSMGVMLGVLGVVLVLGMVGIVAAAVRESRLVPGQRPDGARRRLALIASGIAFVVVCSVVYLGGRWWNVAAAGYEGNLYHASELRPTLTGNTLDLLIGNPDDDAPDKWRAQKNADLLLDHGHVMHLYAIRMPEMDAAFHLHPEPEGKQGLRDTLPSMPPGTYKLFADIVHRNGFPETETSTLTVPAGMSTAPLSAEDASAAPSALSAGDLGPSFKLPDGYTMVWDKPAEITASKAYAFRFTLLDPAGKPAADMKPYLGMAGHAAFVKSDGTTFAHTHPEGSAAMPAMMLANPQEQGMDDMDSMPGMEMSSEAISPTVEFPYGFPASGRYRIFIQMKHGAAVETGVFDAEVR
ncbi:hypothetical protein [Granulicella mallensis]|uniref:YtkA-like domain-containing protein n=1 Tax=Granulicella mallensis (strain ATCC BAA-1857 / DSM 23137 / MP5ACTX8) TaxID=682795 RepID=G8NWR6_GRAMM|nr:hypothetical protein [Granulicella mallensis]AEU38953.1 hypothetical protein AciX8_4683 [Granulicella mallensis MP5ACTX8]